MNNEEIKVPIPGTNGFTIYPDQATKDRWDKYLADLMQSLVPCRCGCKGKITESIMTTPGEFGHCEICGKKLRMII